MTIANAIVGQSGGPTSAINATLFGVMRACYENKRVIKTLYGMKNGIEGFLKEDFVNLFSFFEADAPLDILKSTPACALGSCRVRLTRDISDEVYKRVFDILEKYDIKYFFYIGGNDSMDTVDCLSTYARLHHSSVQFIGIPKTIDNDLVLTDFSPGYGSCAKLVGTVTGELLCDCAIYTQPSVTILEVMGRDAGWIGLATAMAKYNGSGIDLLYIPEVPFSDEKFILDVKNALIAHPNVVVAVCEGIKYENGDYVSVASHTDPFGHTYLSGAGNALLRLVREHIGCKSRVVELSLVQRCASHLASKFDIQKSVEIGQRSVEMALDGKGAIMSAFERTGSKFKITSVPVHLVANKIKYVPREFFKAEKPFITEQGIKYLKPLLCSEHYPKYKDGLPTHFIID